MYVPHCQGCIGTKKAMLDLAVLWFVVCVCVRVHVHVHVRVCTNFFSAFVSKYEIDAKNRVIIVHVSFFDLCPACSQA